MQEFHSVLQDARDRGLMDTCAIDTEATPLSRFGNVSQRWKPHCFSYSFRPGTGYTIYMDNPELVEEFVEWAMLTDPLWIIHNYLFDKDILQDLEIPIRRFDDTMIRAYNLQRIPRGLKPLAFRLCGMKMQDFDDVVRPHSLEVVLDWVSNCVLELSDIMFNPHGKPTKALPMGKLLKTPRRLPSYTTEHQRTVTKLHGILTDTNCDPWARWNDWNDFDRDFISEYFGPMPRKSIRDCPRSVITPYASADADGTIRILPELKRMAYGLRRSVEAY
jgi:hypothetical protein